jgi:hypothetical protein
VTWFVEAAPFNGPDDADAAMNWVDITAYANDNLAPVGAGYGRSTELEAVQPGTLSFIVNNGDHRFTPGNPTSPYYPGWRTGMRVRVRETVGPREFVIFDGNMLQPDMTISTPGFDQTVTVNVVDRIGRLATGGKFVSTLAAHILYQSASTLIGYYPLGDPGPTHRPVVNTAGFPALNELLVTNAATAAVQGAGSYAAQAGTPPPGDDLRPPRFAPLMTGSPATVVSETNLQAYIFGSGVAVATNSTLTIALWATPDLASVDASWAVLRVYFGWNNGLGTGIITIRRTTSAESPPAVWKCSFNDDLASWTSNAYGTGPDLGRAALIAARIELAASKLTLMVNGYTYSGTVSGSFPSTINFLQIAVGDAFTGSLSHLQFHQSTASADYTATTQAAQYVMGTNGLYGQFAGERIKTVALYAGVSAADLAIDQGTAVMQRASLAGKTPLAAAQEAADTDQGLLHAVGRRLVFRSRKRRYDL